MDHQPLRYLQCNFGAPTMLIVCVSPRMMPGTEYANAACVPENMPIAATDLGIDNVMWLAALLWLHRTLF